MKKNDVDKIFNEFDAFKKENFNDGEKIFYDGEEDPLRRIGAAVQKDIETELERQKKAA